MTVRREKSKAQLKNQLEETEEQPKPQHSEGGAWKENLGKYLLDISKYVVTGVIIASTFKDLDDKIIIYVMSFIIAISALIVGLVLTNKQKGN